MNTHQILDAYFDHGSKYANEMLKATMDGSPMSKSSVSPEDAANILMLSLLVRRDLRGLTEDVLREAAQKIDALEIRDGSRVVYNLLLLDLARERSVSLTFARTTRAGGSDLNWDLMQHLKRATPTFFQQIDELLHAHAKVTKAYE